MSTELHRFGIDPSKPPDAQQWAALCKLLVALLTNPHLHVGDNNSLIRFPATPTTVGSKFTAIPPHPFKIAATIDSGSGDLQLFVSVGRAHSIEWRIIGAARVAISYEIPVSFNSGGELLGDDFGLYGGSVGFETLAASTTYGVWIVFSTSGSFVASKVSEYKNASSFGWGSGEIQVSQDFVNPTDARDFSDDIGAPVYAVVYLGRVVVDASKVATIHQYRKSDVSMPAFSMPVGLISEEAGNSLNASYPSNPGLYVKTVSEDADNSISVGGDGGAYYDAP
jgi:hypothetical protein